MSKEMDENIGYRPLFKKSGDGGRMVCRNGKLCRSYMAKGASIYSLGCPYNCEYYIPISAKIEKREKGKEE